MRLEEPRWWRAAKRGQKDLASTLLSPVGRLYGAIVEARYRRREAYRSALPVICIGNFTAGGTGKTPLALLVIEHLERLGEVPICLTRGYGGRKPGPLRVDPDLHTARDVGDEALLIARRVAVMVARDRVAGARAIETEEGGTKSVIVMDDGLQNPGLAKDLSIAVIDGDRGLGNGSVMPAGPLRAPLDFQLGLVDCIVVNGSSPEGVNEGAILERLKRGFPGPVLEAHAVPAEDSSWLKSAPVVAYAGIGNPMRFFTTLRGLGAHVEEEVSFPDHHVFSEHDADRLIRTADTHGAGLVTTEKDLARLSGAKGRCGELLRRSLALPVRLAFEERDLFRLQGLIEAAIKVHGRQKTPPR